MRMSNDEDEKRKQVLNINFEVDKKGDLYSKYFYQDKFLEVLKEDFCMRQNFFAQILSWLNYYIENIDRGDKNDT